MKRVLIADITSLVKNNKLYGHFRNTAKNFQEILSDEFEVFIVGENVYKQYFHENVF